MRIALVIIALVLPLAPAVAQRVPELTHSTRLRVTTTTSAGPRIGIYQALTDTTLVLAAGVTPFVVPISEISRLERSRGRTLSVAGGLSGFIVGGVTGGLLGCAANRDSYGVFCGGQSDTKVFLGAALGGIAGAALGAVLLRRERWSTIDVNDLRSAAMPLPEPIRTRSGLVYETVVKGNGAVARTGQTVRIHETLTLPNGKLIFNSRTNGKPVTFLLGGNQVIAGVDEGVTGMRVGERRKLVVPPSLDGRTFDPDFIPPGTMLHYEIELVEILSEPSR